MKNVKKKTQKVDSRGITLIALVVTIIILIILATISVNMVFSENGLIATAKEAREHQANATVSDQTELDKGAEEAANIIAGGSGAGGELPEITPDTPAGTEVKKPETTTPEDKWSNKVTAISDGSGNAIPLPNGFYYVGGSRTEGLVISDNAADKNKGTSYETASTLVGNQFVWIPVDNEAAFTRTKFDETTGQPTTGLDTTKYTEPYERGYSDGAGTEEAADFNTMKTQVLKYKGFYIGRYEAGDANSATTLRTKVTTDHTVVSKKGVAPYNYVPWGESYDDINTKFAPGKNNSDNVETHGVVYLSNHMYDGAKQKESVTSTLCYGSQWDAMCRYIGDSQRTTPTKSAPGLTGSVSTDVSKNIYDLAGNCQEWTMEDEFYRTSQGFGVYDRVFRGSGPAVQRPISYRGGSGTDFCYEDTSFRLEIYVKD